ncbi:MAG TPA: hypothetical protein VM925_20120, partial [Labilithrix sp.]|nr:hypothetical protein [Labilithrix sp.]
RCRASAVPVLRAALAESGIASEARGIAVLSLWQVFAPYAPAEILVRTENAEQAIKILRHWSLGEEAPKRTEPPVIEVPRFVQQPWSLARRTIVLGACVAATPVAFVGASLPESQAADALGPPPKLEVVRIDDTIEPLLATRDPIPDNVDIELRSERVPVGTGSTKIAEFASLTLRSGETKAHGMVRFREWLETIALPEGARFGIGEIEDYDPDTGTAKLVGLRTFVLSGEAVLNAKDVTDAIASVTPQSEPPDVYVAVLLSADGARRFEEFTREWTNQRAAILIDDEVNTAPVIRTTITGGRISLSMGKGDTKKNLHDAKRLAARLHAH